jgi:murein DD-endopeptidase MepM/ murein hydrolase activator NlpD
MAYLTINNPCSTAPPPWYHSSALAVSASKTLRVQQDPNNPCSSNYTTTQWVPIPIVTNYVPIPCPGDIVSNPTIARSNAVNINGGRFGLTRIDKKTHQARMHKGLDILAQPNTTIYAAYGGRVTRVVSQYASDYYGGPASFGNLIEIQSTLPNGTVISMLYGHLNSPDASVFRGAIINQGQIIALSGRTGNAKKGYSPHVHIQVVVNGNKVDPEPFMATKFDSAGQSTGSPCAP